jgi:hypothetical protein
MICTPHGCIISSIKSSSTAFTRVNAVDRLVVAVDEITRYLFHRRSGFYRRFRKSSSRQIAKSYELGFCLLLLEEYECQSLATRQNSFI